ARQRSPRRRGLAARSRAGGCAGQWCPLAGRPRAAQPLAVGGPARRGGDLFRGRQLGRARSLFADLRPAGAAGAGDAGCLVLRTRATGWPGRPVVGRPASGWTAGPGRPDLADGRRYLATVRIVGGAAAALAAGCAESTDEPAVGAGFQHRTVPVA